MIYIGRLPKRLLFPIRKCVTDIEINESKHKAQVIQTPDREGVPIPVMIRTVTHFLKTISESAISNHSTHRNSA